jgi:hypothetical protein
MVGVNDVIHQVFIARNGSLETRPVITSQSQVKGIQISLDDTTIYVLTAASALSYASNGSDWLLTGNVSLPSASSLFVSMVVDDDKLYIAFEPTAGSPVSLYTVSLVGDGHVSKAAQYPATFAMQPLPLGSCGDLLLVAVSSGVVVLRKTPLGLIEVGRELYIDWHSSWVLRVDQVTCQVVIRTESGLLTITPHCDVSSIRAVSIVQGNGMASVLGDALLFAREDGVGIAWVDRHLQLQHALLHRVVGGVTTVVGARESGYYAFGTSTTATVYICSTTMLECHGQPLISNTLNSTTLLVTDGSFVTSGSHFLRLQPRAGIYPVSYL